MSLTGIERNMEMLKLVHTRPCVAELLEEASREKRGLRRVGQCISDAHAGASRRL